MKKNLMLFLSIGMVLLLSGCAAKAPLDLAKNDAIYKAFPKPADGKSGLYIYRDSHWGKVYKKYLYVDGKVIGETSNRTYLYLSVNPGTHQISTESEFGNNSISFEAKSGNTYFARQYLKLGVLAEGANLKMVSEEEGRKGVLRSKKIGQKNSF